MGFQPLLLLCLLQKNSSNMSKSTYFTGQPVYSQVIKLLDKAKIQQISQEIGSSDIWSDGAIVQRI